MKNVVKSAENKNFEKLISMLSENEILNIQAMSVVKGGEGDGVPVIIMPK